MFLRQSKDAVIGVRDSAADARVHGSCLDFPQRFAYGFHGRLSGEFASGLVDGMKCDERGNVYVTGPRGIWVFSPAGRHLGVIGMPEHAGNLNWGGRDWDELYCACSTSIYRVKLKVRGNRVAYMGMR